MSYNIFLGLGKGTIIKTKIIMSLWLSSGLFYACEKSNTHHWITMTFFGRNIENKSMIDSQKLTEVSFDKVVVEDCDGGDKIFLSRYCKGDGFKRSFIAIPVEKSNLSEYKIFADCYQRGITLSPGHHKLIFDGGYFFYEQVFEHKK